MMKKKPYKPRARKCTHCPKFKAIDSEKGGCSETGWEIKLSLAKLQAVCKE